MPRSEAARREPSRPEPASGPLKLAVHGQAAELHNFIPSLEGSIRRFLAPFVVGSWPDGFAPVQGTVRPYDQAEVLRHLSPRARALPATQDLMEVYQDGERFWLVDERWGMAEINFLKGQWRSWVLPQPQLDVVRRTEMAVVWPMAQLLRPRGIYLLPAAAAVRNGWAFLIVCPFGVEPELSALVRSGYKLIGQRWTAVREEEGRLALLHMPGVIRRDRAPQWNAETSGGPRETHDRAWGDINDHALGAWQHHAFCDAVLIANPGRRPRASLQELGPASSVALLRQAWPIIELHPSGRHSALPAKLAHSCRCAELQLSGRPGELMPLLDVFRDQHASLAA